MKIILSLFIMASLSSFAQSSDIVYGVSPLFLSYGHKIKGLEALRKRLPEIKELGIDIVWLQPITPAFEEDGHGYDVIDYRSVSPLLGTAADLKKLVDEAHKNKMKIILDVVLNHSSFEHPFVKDIAKKGKASAYYDFYQHESIPGVPYANVFHQREIGKASFTYYFWEHLLNFNYNSRPLRDYLLGSLEFWMKEFSVDGFRFDASWGPSSRWPEFYKTLSGHLREIDPSVILIAEDMAGYPAAYKNTGHPHLKNSGFDWAYDWNNQDADWISKWSFQLEGEGFENTVFNLRNPEKEATEFVRSLKFGEGIKEIKTIRYIENNDTPGFLKHHTPAEARWAAKIMFLLPGVPLVFYGQETGNNHDVFELPSFDPARKISSYNPALWSFYKNLIRTRKSSAILSDGTISAVVKKTKDIICFERRLGNEVLKIELHFATKKVFINSKLL